MNVLHPTTGRKVQTVSDAVFLLEKAREIYREAHNAADSARAIETTALHALNDAQRDFDDAVSAIRADSGAGSDWDRKEREGRT